MKNNIALFVLITFCFTFTHAQTTRTTPTTPPPAPKLDSTGRLQGSGQLILEDLCVQSAVLRRDLPAATRQKALPAIGAVRALWGSAPGKVDALNLARSEVRRIFGTRPRNVEDVLVCHVFGEALWCGDKRTGATWMQYRENQTMFENFDQKANQLFNLLSTVIKNMKEMNGGVIRNIL
jgi:hypothetical protein